MLSAEKTFTICVVLLFGASNLSGEIESGTTYKKRFQALNDEQTSVAYQLDTATEERLGSTPIGRRQITRKEQQVIELLNQPETNGKETWKTDLNDVELSKQLPTGMQDTQCINIKNRPPSSLNEDFPSFVPEELNNQLLLNTDNNAALELSELRSGIEQDNQNEVFTDQLPNELQKSKKRKLQDLIRIQMTEKHETGLEQDASLLWTQMQTRQANGLTLEPKKSMRISSMGKYFKRTKSYINKRFGGQGSFDSENQQSENDKVVSAGSKPMSRLFTKSRSQQRKISAPTPEPRGTYAFYLVDYIINIVVLPGSGEFVYDTKIQKKTELQKVPDKQRIITQGSEQSINEHNNNGMSDAMLSLNQLKEDFPRVEWVSVVVNWFADSLNIRDCEVYPAVEFNEGFLVKPDDWQVGSLKRNKARRISRDINGKPRHGGTISDGALIRYINELHRRGYKVILYPKLVLDTPDEEWRGRLTGQPFEMNGFFENKYNLFINHYSNIARETKVAAFIIGSELVGLTSIRDIEGNYPAVTELVQLAQEVKFNLGKDIIVTYAADWAEYSITYGGWYPMDKLWTSDSIDVVGINAYFPLTDGSEPHSGYSVEDIILGWTSGEGYDYFTDYSTGEPRSIPFNDGKWAVKNIEKWWSGYHLNPDYFFSTWRPKMKKIWFTEFGFPSVDACTNDPYVFNEGSSKNPLYPRFSMKKVSFKSQRIAIEGTIRKWLGSEMVEKMFLYAWDARPFPYFPIQRDVWADGASWETGPWIQGKIGDLLGDSRESVVSSRRSLSLPKRSSSISGSTLRHPTSGSGSKFSRRVNDS